MSEFKEHVFFLGWAMARLKVEVGRSVLLELMSPSVTEDGNYTPAESCRAFMSKEKAIELANALLSVEPHA